MKDPDQVQPPGGDFFLVVLCVENLRDCVPFAVPDDFPLDIRDSPGIMPKVNEVLKACIAGV